MGLSKSLIASTMLFCACAAGQPQSRFEDVERFVAIADIHGAYDAFETLLRNADIVDAELDWVGAADHLIIVGDVLDRGPDSRRALDLIMKLEPQARDAGGAVHFVLGNHELMNLTGDLRYVSDAEYAAFAMDETPEMRAAAFAEFAGTIEDFDAQFPPGFFAHRQAFSAAGRYGAWLLQRPFLLTVNDWAFVHGGLAQASRELMAGDFNATLQEQLRSYTVALDALINLGVLSAADNFYDHPDVLEAFAARVEAGGTVWPEAADTAASIVTQFNTAFAFDTEGPAWYRGNVGCSALIATDRLSATLTMAGVEHLVVGHTPTRDASVHSHHEERLYRIDTGMLNEYYGGRGAALIVEGNRVRAIYEHEAAAQEVSAQPRRVGVRPDNMSTDDLLAFLASADVIEVTPMDTRWSRVRLRRGDVELEAVFTAKPSRNIQPDLAAWQLDRMLGVDMIPATVSREIDGTEGTLQYLPQRTIDEQQRQTERLGAGAWCPLADQFGAMYIFDALIGNTGRTLDRLLYNTENFQVILVGHDMSFPSSRNKPVHLAELELPLTGLWVERLRALEEENLETAFAGVLDRRRIRALLARRDAILTDAGIAQ
jgi:hypothetical protein